MKILAIAVFSVLLAACSYEFSQPPFQEDELIEITKSEFGKELLSHVNNFPDLEEVGGPDDDLNELSLVYVAADDFLIQQDETEEGPGWELTVWTKNAHHIISCSIMQDDNFAIDEFDSKALENGTMYLDGTAEELKHLAVQLSLRAPKLCVAFPYANPADVIDPTAEYKKQIELLTTELDTATNAKTEYQNQIDQLTTELDAATNAASREQRKAQDLEKQNQQLDEELSSAKSRSSQILIIALVIGGILALAIAILGVRSRIKKTDTQQ